MSPTRLGSLNNMEVRDLPGDRQAVLDDLEVFSAINPHLVVTDTAVRLALCDTELSTSWGRRLLRVAQVN